VIKDINNTTNSDLNRVQLVREVATKNITELEKRTSTNTDTLTISEAARAHLLNDSYWRRLLEQIKLQNPNPVQTLSFDPEKLSGLPLDNTAFLNKVITGGLTEIEHDLRSTYPSHSFKYEVQFVLNLNGGHIITKNLPDAGKLLGDVFQDRALDLGRESLPFKMNVVALLANKKLVLDGLKTTKDPITGIEVGSYRPPRNSSRFNALVFLYRHQQLDLFPNIWGQSKSL
jgi:hypothetical protein